MKEPLKVGNEGSLNLIDCIRSTFLTVDKEEDFKLSSVYLL
jgi:hypothetical protein